MLPPGKVLGMAKRDGIQGTRETLRVDYLQVRGVINLAGTGTFRTAPDGQRVEITAIDNDRITFYAGSGVASPETDAASIQTDSSSGSLEIIGARNEAGSYGRSEIWLGAGGGIRLYDAATGGTGYLCVEADVTSSTDNPVYLRVDGSLKQVTQGADDSGGAGYAYLRVTN